MQSSEPGKHILIVTDAWHPQVNGVVKTIDKVQAQLQKDGYKVSLLTPEDFYTVPVPFYQQITMSVWPKNDKGVRQKILELKPDYIHIATEGTLGQLAANCCYRLKLNYTSSYHTKYGEYAHEWGLTHAKSAVEHFLTGVHNYACHILAPTASVCKELEEKGYKNVVEWTRGIDTSVFHPLTTEDNPIFGDIKRPVFLYIGRISKEKGLEDFLALDLPGSKVIVGDGPKLKKYKKKYPDAIYIGEIKDKDLVAKYYRNSDVFVFPSRTDTFGNVVLEALASGVPVAAFEATGPKDIITSPEVGALAAYHNGGKYRQQNREALKQACLDALELKKKGCEDICVNFIKSFGNHYTWGEAARILENNVVSVGAPNAR